ncbi:MAG TPA: FAD-binding oxidoreductase [Chloroflexota bacterium]|nr:FAD-binding oxidoreductase [Chloroflexota bacterium]
MSERADVVIIGGGAVGTSIAYHLAKRGAGRGVVLLERNTLGSGSTGRSAGGIRSQFSTEVNIRFSLESVEFWRSIARDIDYREIGYLFLATTDQQRQQFERNIALQNALGVPSRLVSPSDMAGLVRGMRVDDLSAGAYSVEDALAGPNEAVQWFARHARQGGVQIREDVEVLGVDTRGDRVNGVETTAGRIDTHVVVNAAGAWAGLVGKMAGLDVPVRGYRRELFVSEAVGLEVIPEVPLVIDLQVGWYFRREGPGILMSGARDTEPSFNTHVDWAGLPKIAEYATWRMPPLAAARFGDKAWAGLYDVSPDDHAIIGSVPTVAGFYCANGFSGHGFQHSPATGRVVAELILDGQASGFDVSPLSITRFRSGALLQEPLTAHAGSFAG